MSLDIEFAQFMKVYSEIDQAKVGQEINLNIIPFIGFALKRLNTT